MYSLRENFNLHEALIKFICIFLLASLNLAQSLVKQHKFLFIFPIPLLYLLPKHSISLNLLTQLLFQLLYTCYQVFMLFLCMLIYLIKLSHLYLQQVFIMFHSHFLLAHEVVGLLSISQLTLGLVQFLFEQRMGIGSHESIIYDA